MKAVHIDPEHLRKIIHVLKQFPVVRKAAVFGSRALGTEKPGSDVDLVLYGDIDDQILGKIRTALDDTVLPYFFDVVVYDTIRHPPFLEHIETYGQVIFERKEQHRDSVHP